MQSNPSERRKWTTDTERKISDCHLNPPQIYRHGARGPTKGVAEQLKLTLSRLKSAREYRSSLLNFIEDYEYRIGDENLLPYGALE